MRRRPDVFAAFARLGQLPAPLRAAACYAVAVAAAKALGLALLPVMTAALAPAEFARLELLLSLGEIAGLLLAAGLVDTLYRFVALDGRAAVARVAGLGLAMGALGLALAGLGAPLGAWLPLPAPPLEVLLLGAAVALDVALGVPLALLRVDGRAGAYAGMVVLRGALHVVLATLLLRLGAGVAGVLGAAALAALVVAGWLLAYGAPLTLGGLAAFALGAADRWFLAEAVPGEALAEYALAVKLAMAAAFLTQPFELWWYPRRVALLAAPGGAAESERMVGLGGALVLLAAGAAAVAGPALVGWATPPAYHGAARWIPWLTAALAMQSLGSLVNVGCYARRSTNQALAVNGLAGLAALAGYALLVPPFGVAGAVAATLLGQAVRLVAFWAMSHRSAPLDYPLGRLALLALPVAGASALPQWLGSAPAALALALLALLGCTLLAAALRLLPLPALPGSPRHA